MQPLPDSRREDVDANPLVAAASAVFALAMRLAMCLALLAAFADFAAEAATRESSSSFCVIPVNQVMMNVVPEWILAKAVCCDGTDSMNSRLYGFITYMNIEYTCNDVRASSY